MIDNRDKSFAVNHTLIAHLCHRRFGIGADGLILLQNIPGYDFEMVYFNADGSEGSMCGNGGRCTVKFAYHLGLFEKNTRFLAVDGVHEATLEDGVISLKMSDVEGIKMMGDDYFLNTGSPHYVSPVSNLENYPVFVEGKAIRYNEQFKEKGTNVNFVEQIAENKLFVRTYERGVEDETYSCGTGVTASALAFSLKGLKSPVQIKTLGGNLQVSFQASSNQSFEHIFLMGEAQKVFEGFYTIEV